MNELINAITTAEGKWVTWDWPQFFGYDQSGLEVIMCGRPYKYVEYYAEACEYALNVEVDAAIAWSHAQDAISHLKNDNLMWAITLLELAVKIEKRYGDAPTYGPLLEMALRLKNNQQ